MLEWTGRGWEREGGTRGGERGEKKGRLEYFGRRRRRGGEGLGQLRGLAGLVYCCNGAGVSHSSRRPRASRHEGRVPFESTFRSSGVAVVRVA